LAVNSRGPCASVIRMSSTRRVASSDGRPAISAATNETRRRCSLQRRVGADESGECRCLRGNAIVVRHARSERRQARRDLFGKIARKNDDDSRRLSRLLSKSVNLKATRASRASVRVISRSIRSAMRLAASTRAPTAPHQGVGR
jgi:hypothetical protein